MKSKITDPKFIARLTNRAIPVDPRQPIQVVDVRDEGSWQYDTVVYDSIWAGGESIPLVLRTYRSPFTYWQTQDYQQRNREWAVLRRLRLDSFPSPRPLARDEAEAGDFIIWRDPPGENWYRPDQDIATQARPFVPQLAGLLARLHTLDPNSLNNEPLYQATVAGTLVRMLLWSREMGSEDLRQVIARLKPAVAKLKSWSPRLLHGNPHLGNVLVDQTMITTLLNWENAAIGDPRWDVMTAAHWLRQADPDLGEQLVNWYETFTGHTIGNRPFWWAMVSVRLWALKSWTYHALRHGRVPADFAEWVEDLPQAETRAFRDLAEAGL